MAGISSRTFRDGPSCVHVECGTMHGRLVAQLARAHASTFFLDLDGTAAPMLSGVDGRWRVLVSDGDLPSMSQALIERGANSEAAVLNTSNTLAALARLARNKKDWTLEYFRRVVLTASLCSAIAPRTIFIHVHSRPTNAALLRGSIYSKIFAGMGDVWFARPDGQGLDMVAFGGSAHLVSPEAEDHGEGYEHQHETRKEEQPGLP
ncbi:MAG: hypothetical protein JRN39_01725 [Nitrososphaerota archaeon]|nr:hypothetical protein [Nitrososphaerota archaeon]